MLNRRSAIVMSLLATVLLCAAPDAPASGSAAVRWQSLTLVEGRSTHPATTFATRADGAWVMAGEGADKETYTLQLAGLPAKCTALRVDVFPDPALPESGPGRQHRDMVLTEMTASIGAKGAKRGKPLALAKSSASFSQDGFPSLGAIDGVATTGWAIGPKFDLPHHLVVELGKEFATGAGDVLTLELQFQFGGHTAAGCLMVSATDAPPPVRAEGAADEPTWGETQTRVNQAIDRGVEWFLGEQLLDGSFDLDQSSQRNGGTALVVYALLKSGVPKGHPAIERALEWLKCGRVTETYSLGCQLMALHALNDPAFEPWMKELLEALLRNQQPSGAFIYLPGAGGDLSNTQYGVLGMRAAAHRGIKVPAEAWEKAAQYALSTMDDGGGGAYAPLGFTYYPTPGVATGSMTTAGASILAICDEGLRGNRKLGNLMGLARRGGEWVGKNFAVDANPPGDGTWLYYYLYGLERLGALLQVEEFGEHRWYREGARWLVGQQEERGGWPAAGGGACASTAWSLLFLNRATAPTSGKSSRVVAKAWGKDDPNQPMNVRAAGDSPLTFWISSWGDAEREAYEWPGEKGRGLRVKRVEWFAVGVLGHDEPLAIAMFDKDATQPCGNERFGGQFLFDRPGDYSLYARVTVSVPGAAGGSTDATAELPIESSLLAVKVSEVQDALGLEYARDPNRNLLGQQKPAVRATTAWDDNWLGARAVDGLVTRGWACKADDAKPAIVLELEKPVRANVLVLTPIRVGTDRPWPARVHVTVNGKGKPFELEIEAPFGDRPRHKTRLVLGLPQVIRKLELEIVEPSMGAPQPGGFGFAEIELQVDPAANK